MVWGAQREPPRNAFFGKMKQFGEGLLTQRTVVKFYTRVSSPWNFVTIVSKLAYNCYNMLQPSYVQYMDSRDYNPLILSTTMDIRKYFSMMLLLPGNLRKEHVSLGQ